MEQLSSSPSQTQQIAVDLAQQFKTKGGVIALIGDLGSGKTTFTQGFAQGLGIKDKIISPTFVLIRQHKLPNSERYLFHLDLYRLEKETEFSQLGLTDLLADPKNIILIEWAEKILAHLPPKTLVINFQKLPGDKRKISLKN